MELQKNNTSQENGMDHTLYLPEASLRPADILLPDMNVDMKKWAVIACDQFTAQPEYWKRDGRLRAGCAVYAAAYLSGDIFEYR